MEKKKKENSYAEKTSGYLKDSWKNLITSFKSLDKRILHVVIYDLLFFIICFGVFYLFKLLITLKAEPLKGFKLDESALVPGSDLAANTQLLKGFYNTMLFYVILFALILVLVYIFANLLIWIQVTGRKPRKIKFNFAKNFFLINIIWVITWLILFLVVINSLRPETTYFWMLGFIVFYAHLTAIMYISYFKSARIRKAVKQAFNIGFAKIHHFIVPYVFVAVIFYIINNVLRLFIQLPDTYRIFASTIILLFYFAWLRFYVYSFVKDLV